VRNLDALSVLNLALNAASIVVLLLVWRERRTDRRSRREEQLALMAKSRKIYQLGVAEGETRMVQSLATDLGSGMPVERWMSSQLAHLNERSTQSTSDISLLEGVFK
jgi:hypothetical protein